MDDQPGHDNPPRLRKAAGFSAPIASEQPVVRGEPGLSAKPAAYYKSGTIERLWRDVDPVGGIVLAFEEKAICTFLLSLAYAKTGEVRESEITLCAMCNMTQKPWRRWIARLVERGLVTVRRSSYRNQKIYGVAGIYHAYGAERPVDANIKVVGIESSDRTRRAVSRAEIQAAGRSRFMATSTGETPDLPIQAQDGLLWGSSGEMPDLHGEMVAEQVSVETSSSGETPDRRTPPSGSRQGETPDLVPAHVIGRARREENTSPDRDISPSRSGELGAVNREKLPTIPSSYASSSPSQPHVDLVAAFIRRCGLWEGMRYEREEEYTILALACVAWQITNRRQRELVQRYGIVGLSYGVGYVLEQIAARPSTIHTPGGLLVSSLQRRMSAELPSLAHAQEIFALWEQHHVAAALPAPRAVEPTSRIKEKAVATEDAESASSAAAQAIRTPAEESYCRIVEELRTMLPPPAQNALDGCEFAEGSETRWIVRCRGALHRRIVASHIEVLLRDAVSQATNDTIVIEFV